jgi:phosphocarrier protein FPr
MNFLKKLFKREKAISTTLHIGSSNGFHFRPITKFAHEVKKYNAKVTLMAYEKEVDASQSSELTSLSLEYGENCTLLCRGEEAQKASNELSHFFRELMRDDKEEKAMIQEEENYEAPTLIGISVAPGISIAPLFQLKITSDTSKPIEMSINQAIEKVKEELQKLYEQEENSEAEIYLAQKELLSSKIFEQNFTSIEQFQKAIKSESLKLKNTPLESRMDDYVDMQQQVLSQLGIESHFDLPKTPYILLAEALLPSHIAKLSETPIEGVVLKKGTPTSHASILLRSHAIPAVIINQNIEVSKQAILDTNSGNLILNPTKNDLQKAKARQKAFHQRKEQNYNNRFNSTITRKGQTVNVLANIGDIPSAKEAKELGADGVGLLRSEFLFMEQKPTLKEQTQTYGEIFKLFDEITIRTLDIGGDKALPYITIDKEENPFLGIRGIRFSLQEQTLFKEQLLAVGLASTDAKNSKIKIMFPMVSEPQEFIEAKALAMKVYKEHKINTKNIQFGIMIEVPSVIFAIKEFDKLVDFYSIGTNDLTQYLFAIERTHPTLQVEPTSPMIMSALKMIIKKSNKPISICGELAGLGDATTSLINMGYSTLSVSAKLIPSLKERIRNV